MDLDKVTHGMERAINPVCNICDMVGRAILVLMVFLVTTDVVLRYFFNRPIKGSYELVEFMMVVLVFFGLAYTQTKKGHISVSLFTGKMSPERLAVIQSATYLLCLGIFSIIAWRCVVQATVLQTSGETSAVLFIPRYPFMWITAFGSALLSLIFLKDLLQSLDNIIKHCDKPWLWLTIDGIFVLLIFTIPVWFNWLPWDISRPIMGMIGIILLILLMFSSMPVGAVMALIGITGFTYLVNLDAALSLVGNVPYRRAADAEIATAPLFILMGLLCYHADLSKDIFSTMRNWTGRLPGGLAMATVGGCAGFAAVSGSSLATAATMGTIALPEMRRYKYDNGLACGSIAAGASIGILIPPSIPFLIYAMLTEESIAKLFIAGIIPGIMEAVFYILAIYILCKIKPELGPPGSSTTLKDKIKSLKDTWGILILFIIVIGGIYSGIFTATESAGIGASGAFLLGLVKKKWNRSNIIDALAETSRNTAMFMLALIGARFFQYFLTMSQIPFMLSDFVVSLPVPNAVMLLAILFIYLILGCIMPIMGIIILTVPIFFPVVLALGYDPIWFGVVMVIMAELGQITPPIGLNVFILAGVAKDIPLGTIYKGILPFVASDIVRIALIIIFPAIALWLPSLM